MQATAMRRGPAVAVTLAENRKARFDYEILETLEAGLVLSGQEAKAAKQGHISLAGSFVTFHGREAMLTNTHITPYKQASGLKDYDPTHGRRLLLHRRQIKYLQEKTQEKGLTIVPLKVYTKNRLVKVEIAVARGRHLYDKREAIKKRDTDREIARMSK